MLFAATQKYVTTTVGIDWPMTIICTGILIGLGILYNVLKPKRRRR